MYPYCSAAAAALRLITPLWLPGRSYRLGQSSRVVYSKCNMRLAERMEYGMPPLLLFLFRTSSVLSFLLVSFVSPKKKLWIPFSLFRFVSHGPREKRRPHSIAAEVVALGHTRLGKTPRCLHSNTGFLLCHPRIAELVVDHAYTTRLEN